MTSTEKRIERINKDGSPKLKAAVAAGKMGNWTATHLITDKWPHYLQDLVCYELFEKTPVDKFETPHQKEAAEKKLKGTTKNMGDRASLTAAGKAAKKVDGKKIFEKATPVTFTPEQAAKIEAAKENGVTFTAEQIIEAATETAVLKREKDPGTFTPVNPGTFTPASDPAKNQLKAASAPKTAKKSLAKAIVMALHTDS